MYKQIIIARKDLNMSAGKLAAQVAHASMAFLITSIKNNSDDCSVYDCDDAYLRDDYLCKFWVGKDLFEQWINGEYTKVILQAKNKSNLLKAVESAKELGMVEKIDYFLIRDNCHTELTPEEDGRTLTCIGFKPMDAELIDKIGRKYHTYIG